jgi:hypothetical protein
MNEQEKKQLRIRLPASLKARGGPSTAVNVWFTEPELAWLRDAAQLQGYPERGLSTYIRDVCLKAASDEDPSLPPNLKLEAASDRCAYSLGSWIRLIVLATGGYPVERQLFLARTAWTVKKVGDPDFDPRKVEV